MKPKRGDEMGYSKGLTALAVLILLTFAAMSYAATEYECDQYGNCYTIMRFQDKTYVHGKNAETGAEWSETYKHDGTSSGRDSDGDWWRYDRKKGTYWNSNEERRTYDK
jgi:hypothetical protein